MWLSEWANSAAAQGHAYQDICLLIFLTSLFEVVYISDQASQGAASHDNTSDPFHAFMFGLMGLTTVGLTAAQG